jgi:hypothetical protein
LEAPLMNGTTAEILAGAVLLGGATIVLAVVLVRLMMYRAAASDPAAVEEFSMARYDVMMRLTSEEDLEFLSAQPGYRPETGARLRRERRRIFRMYLRALALDFHALHAAARKLVADAPERHADLVGILIRCQLHFWWRMSVIELRLLLPAARLPKLEISGLLQPMESIRLHMVDA